jgi:hypothetical protein
LLVRFARHWGGTGEISRDSAAVFAGRNEIHLGFTHGFNFSSTSNRFSAAMTRSEGRRSIIFTLKGNHIIVCDETDKELLRATVTLSMDRECMLLVSGYEPMERWQFRKMVLENLFFGEHE